MKAASLEAAFHALLRQVSKEHRPRAMRPCWLGPRPPVLWRMPRLGLPVRSCPTRGCRRRPLRLVSALQRRDPCVPTRALRINPSSPGRITLADVRVRARSTGQPGSPLMRICSLQRIKPRRAVRAATHRTIPLWRWSRGSCRRAFLSTGYLAIRLCGFSLAFPSPFRNWAFGPQAVETPASRSCIASFLGGAVPLSAGLAQPCSGLQPERRSWDLTLRSLVPARKRRDVSIEPVPPAVS
jgi:hypothetical protein